MVYSFSKKFKGVDILATEKNITMKQFNGTDYDTLYPKTIASQIPDVYSKTEVLALIDDKARIQTGSYVGTGTYGKDNPCTLTFDFIPGFVYIQPSNDTSYMMLPYVWGSGVIRIEGAGSTHYKDSVSISENTMSWYLDSGSSYGGQLQLNNKNTTYNYVAIGF